MKALTCAFGVAWSQHLDGRVCRKCRAEADRLEREFWRHVFLGRFDADGFTPSDRRAMKQRAP